MDTQYVVVLEVDNKRASAAYQKGLSDLVLVWPQLMEHAEKVDSLRRAKYKVQQEERRLRREKREAAIAAYDRAVKEWEEKMVFRGPRPSYPWTASDYEGIDWLPSYRRDSLESIRAELQHMANLAGAAVSPYRMTEHQVRGMVAWEDGSTVEQLKKEATAVNNSYTMPA